MKYKKELKPVIILSNLNTTKSENKSLLAKSKIIATIKTCKTYNHAETAQKMYKNFVYSFGRDADIEKDLFIKLMQVA